MRDLSLQDWVYTVTLFAVGTVLVASLPWAIRKQRAYKPERIPAVVRVYVLTAIAAYTAGLGVLYSYWGVAVGAAFLVFGVMIPNVVEHRRAARHQA